MDNQHLPLLPQYSLVLHPGECQDPERFVRAFRRVWKRRPKRMRRYLLTYLCQATSPGERIVQLKELDPDILGETVCSWDAHWRMNFNQHAVQRLSNHALDTLISHELLHIYARSLQWVGEDDRLDTLMDQTDLAPDSEDAAHWLDQEETWVELTNDTLGYDDFGLMLEWGTLTTKDN